MTATLDAIVTAFVYISTAIASLRAGSRALYVIRHDGALGIMDGPLILGPGDVMETKQTHATKSLGEDSAEVSKLWESAYGFQKAVQLSLNGTKNSQGELLTSDQHFDAVTVGNIAIENKKRGHYSLASPHKSLPTQDDSLLIGGKYIPNQSTDGIGGKITKSNLSIKFWGRGNLKSRTIPPAPPSTIGSIPSIYRSLIETTSKSKRYSSKQEIDKPDSEILDCSTVLSSIIPIPNTPSEDTDAENETTIPSHRVARIKAYAPKVFSSLRPRFGIENDDFVKSVVGSGPYVSFQSNSKGSARSGGYFFFTRDGAYMVKTIKKAEVTAFLDLLPNYQKYMMRYGRRSLISRCCGIYGVQISDSSHQVGHSWLDEDEDVFIITNSVFPAESSQFISERFDLKGSTVGRECTDEEIEKKGCNAILKDLDLAREFKVLNDMFPSSRPRKCGINIGSRAKAALLSQLRRDTEFLVECGVMDYSLLVGVVNMDRTGQGVDLDTLLSTIATTDTGSCDDSLQVRKQRALLSKLTTPLQQLFAPPLYIAKRCYDACDSILMSILTLPLPYYGAGICGVNGGSHSVIPGYRFGHKAVYYIGVIDFLQPWTFRKYIEREMKGAIGFDKQAISCVHPEDYAQRFLAFLDQHII